MSPGTFMAAGGELSLHLRFGVVVVISSIKHTEIKSNNYKGHREQWSKIVKQ